MKISAFTMVRNATKYYFPIKQSIQSALPLVDEYIVALGDCDIDDNTRKEIESIKSNKIKIIDRIWSKEDFIHGRIFAKETTFALSQCIGDWCLFLQADELLHEDDHQAILKHCYTHLENKKVDGFLFHYYHFYGDYKHYLPLHGWCKNDIRILRNNINAYSYKDAQSFRKNNNQKLNVIPVKADIYHYGWVRPPSLMQIKKQEQEGMHHGKKKAAIMYASKSDFFDYGPLGKIPIFKGTHPKVMDSVLSKFNWSTSLNYSKQARIKRKKLKHEKWKNRFITFLENTFNKGEDFFGYSNWNKIKNV